MTIVAKVWNNGEFTLGFSRPIDDSPMGLSNPSNSRMEISDHRKAARGEQNKFTSNAKRIVRNACELLGAKEKLSFLTLTLPPLPIEDENLLRGSADVLIHRYIEWLSRRLIKFGLSGEIVAIREFQKRGALHWHLAFVGCKRPYLWAISKESAKAQWSACLANLLGREVDCSTATRIERVRKCVSRYLTKYMSKSNTANEGSCENPLSESTKQTPITGRAWNVSNSLRRRIKVIRSEKLGLIIWNHRGELPFLWLREFEWEGKVVGLVGKLPWKGDACRDELHRWQDKLFATH